MEVQAGNENTRRQKLVAIKIIRTGILLEKIVKHIQYYRLGLVGSETHRSINNQYCLKKQNGYLLKVVKSNFIQSKLLQ